MPQCFLLCASPLFLSSPILPPSPTRIGWVGTPSSTVTGGNLLKMVRNREMTPILRNCFCEFSSAQLTNATNEQKPETLERPPAPGYTDHCCCLCLASAVLEYLRCPSAPVSLDIRHHRAIFREFLPVELCSSATVQPFLHLSTFL